MTEFSFSGEILLAKYILVKNQSSISITI